MKISELFRQLSFGELSNLAISESGSGEIVEAKWPQLIHYTNDALTVLYTRFLLREKEVIISQMAEIIQYHLLSKHSETVGTDDYLYIKDTPEEPFLDDVVRIFEVWGSNERGLVQFPLNDEGNSASLFTPSPLILQVPRPADGIPLSILYQAYHPRLADIPAEGETAIDLDQIIDIPHYLNNALQKWVASEVFSHMNGQENLIKGQEYKADYEAACLEVEQRDLASQSWRPTHTKLDQRGFV